jgi:hypothetical protein
VESLLSTSAASKIDPAGEKATSAERSDDRAGARFTAVGTRLGGGCRDTGPRQAGGLGNARLD